jgi:ribosome maturation factor RimP
MGTGLTNADIIGRVEELLQPLLEAQGLELVEVQFTRPRRGRANLRLFLDRQGTGGITLDEIIRVSRVVSNLLDVHDFIGPSYNLEVSSPGLTRQLKNLKDYQRYAGRLVRLTTKSAIGGRQVHRGILQGLEDDVVCLEEEGQVQRIPLEEIAKARLDL